MYSLKKRKSVPNNTGPTLMDCSLLVDCFANCRLVMKILFIRRGLVGTYIGGNFRDVIIVTPLTSKKKLSLQIKISVASEKF